MDNGAGLTSAIFLRPFRQFATGRFTSGEGQANITRRHVNQRTAMMRGTTQCGRWVVFGSRLGYM